MRSASKAAPALQERSRDTLHRLLQACTEVLEKEGLEAATIPRIARKAGVAAGSVYRRFPDKDALLQETFAQLFEAAGAHNVQQLTPDRLPAANLQAMARILVRSVIMGYRTRPGLVRSMIRYLHQKPDAAFKRRAEELQRRTFDQMCSLLLAFRKEIRHPDPEFAVRFGLLTVVSTAQNVVVLGVEEVMDADEVQGRLEKQLMRTLLAYLLADDAGDGR